MRVYMTTYILLLTITFKVVQCSCNNRETTKYLKSYLSVEGELRNISLYWGSDPARAAAALFAVSARKQLNYQNIYLVQGPHDLQELNTEVKFDKSGTYNDGILALSTAWKPATAPTWIAGGNFGLAGARLKAFGASTIPANQRLHLHLAKQFYHKAQCANVNRWSFYTELNALKDCGFINSDVSDNNGGFIYELISNNESLAEALKLRVNSASMHLKFVQINRRNLFQKLREGNMSFLFIDYDIWATHSGVRAVQLPPCVPDADSACQQELDTVISIRAADTYMLETYAPHLLKAAHDFKPSLKSIRTILELEANGTTIEDAACESLSQEDYIIDSVKTEYSVAIMFCADDPNLNDLKKLLYVLPDNTNMTPTFDITKDLSYRYKRYNCSDSHYIKSLINTLISQSYKNTYIGAVVSGGNDIGNIANDLEELSDLPILLYDAAAVDVKLMKSVWATNGRSLHLALALRHFIGDMRWTRIGVISDDTPTAKAFVNSLEIVQKDQYGTYYFVFGDHPVKSNLRSEDARAVLQTLKDENARIILVNTNYKDAFTILSEAVNLKMNAIEQYAWIVRDWRPNKIMLDIMHFTVSFWSRSRNDTSISSNEQGVKPDIRNIIDSLWPGFWPQSVVALTDAILTMVHVFKYALQTFPQLQYDLRSQLFIRQVENGFTTSPVRGLMRNLTFKEHSLEEAFVFLDEWHGGSPKLLEQWSVNVTASNVRTEHKYAVAYSGHTPPHDGASKCIAQLEHSYNPSCYDIVWITLLVFLILAIPTTIWLARRIRYKFRKREKKIILELLTRRQQRAAGLSTDYLVERSALQISYELGVGRFGCVRLALLSAPHSSPRYVAVKELYDTQDEEEILREACTLASLNHEHIIRLVGVCVDADSPLVLMEVAFFGDLRQYLRTRRYLAECSTLEPEVDRKEEYVHVSAEALTRLARQAALALEYLSLRGVIHRDLRASNCLVDASRSLKLADFGMARMAGVDGGAEYACRRRGIFPVLWMAPESLESGVFSTASDMWAFGVLVLELVTLGARPYGDMTPLRVMHFVTAGGKPPMPRKTAPQTMGLVRLCWKREPEHRPTAAEMVTYLSDRPTALCPALDSDRDQPTDVDSGFGDSPASESLLPCSLNENTLA